MAKTKIRLNTARYLDESDVRSLLRLADLCQHGRDEATKRGGVLNAFNGIMLGAFAKILRDNVIPEIQDAYAAKQSDAAS